MDTSDKAADVAGLKSGPELDFAGLLGSSQVFAAGSDPQKQAELIDANCNKIGVEGCCGPA